MSFGFGFGFPSWRTLAGGFSPAALFVGGVQGAWYDPSDLSTLFTTSAGTTPVAMPGQGSAVSVGLMLDKSQGLVLGSELVTNGDFSNGTTGWINWLGRATSLTAPGGVGRLDFNVSDPGIQQDITFPSAGTFKVEFDFTCQYTGQGAFRAFFLGGFVVSGSGDIAISPGQTRRLTFYATRTSAGTSSFVIGPAGAPGPANGYFLVDNVSIKQVLGNHAIAFNDTTARPELRARVNLLEYSEQFDNGAWSKTNFTVTANAAIAPDGTQTADLLAPTSPATTSFVIQTTAATSGQVRLSYFAKQNTGRYFVIVRGPYANFDYAVFDLQSGTVTLQPTFAGSSAIISPENNGYYRCTLISSQATGTQAFSISDSASGLGSGTGGSVFLWGADLRPANIGAAVPAYQRIADANTYDTSGFPLYLRFDGIDDSMYTPANLNLSGTDKVAVFAGVRRLTNTDGCVTELTSGTTNGLSLFASTLGGNSWFFSAFGTTQLFGTVAPYNAPITNVLTEQLDKAAPADATRISARVNAAAVSLSYIGSLGVPGNFANAPLYIGSRNNSTFWLNGHLHSLIIAGSAVSAGNISATEQWVANKTGIVIP